MNWERTPAGLGYWIRTRHFVAEVMLNDMSGYVRWDVAGGGIVRRGGCWAIEGAKIEAEFALAAMGAFEEAAE